MRSGTARQRTGNAVSAGADTLASTAPAASSLDELQVPPRSGEHCHSTALSVCVCLCGVVEGRVQAEGIDMCAKANIYLDVCVCILVAVVTVTDSNNGNRSKVCTVGCV